MNYQELMDTSGTFTIQDHLMAMRAGFKSSRLSDSLKENVFELKWNRNADAQALVYKLLDEISDEDKVGDVEKIDELLQIVNADRVINGTSHTFQEHFDEEDDPDFV